MSSAESHYASSVFTVLCSYRPIRMRPVCSAKVHEVVAVFRKLPPRMTIIGVSVATLLDLASPHRVDRSVELGAGSASGCVCHSPK